MSEVPPQDRVGSDTGLLAKVSLLSVPEVLRTPNTLEERESSLLTTYWSEIHFIIVMIKRTGLAPWGFEFPFPGSFTSAFLKHTGTCSAEWPRCRATSLIRNRPPPLDRHMTLGIVLL